MMPPVSFTYGVGMFDDAVLGFPCPQCAHKTKKTIAWIKANNSLSCEGCGGVIHLNRDCGECKTACLAGFFVFGFFCSAEHLAAAYVALPFSISHRSAPGLRRSQGCGFGAAIVVHRSAKFDGALTQIRLSCGRDADDVARVQGERRQWPPVM